MSLGGLHGRAKRWITETELSRIASFGFGEGVARALNWGLLALLPLILHSSLEYGRVGLIVSIEMIISNLTIMGLDRAILRFYSLEDSSRNLIRSVLTLWAMLSWIPFALVLLLLPTNIDTFFGIPLFPHLLLLSMTIAFFNLHLLCVCIGRARRQLGTFLRFRVGYVALKFIFVLILAAIFGNSLSYIIGVSISSILMLFLIVHYLKGIGIGHSSRTLIGQMLIFGWPFIFHVISGNVISYFSRFFLEVYNTTMDVGIFTFAYTLGGGLYIGYAVLGTYFEPRIYSHSNNIPRCEKWLMFYTRACIALSTFVGMMLLLAYPYLTPYLHPDYSQAFPVISMVMATFLLAPLYLQGNYRLTAHRKTGYIAIASLFGACISIIFNFMLIPSRGLWGAAMAMYISNFVLMVGILTASIRMTGIPFNALRILPEYAIYILVSFSVLVLADHPGIAIFSLLAGLLTSLGFLAGSFTFRRNMAK